MDEKVKIIIIEDNDTFREGLRILLQSRSNYNIIADSNSYLKMAESIAFLDADIILMDLMMPDITGIDAASKILWKYPEKSIIAITMFTDEAYLLELMGAGFKGCVFKSNIYNELDIAIKIVLEGKRYFPNNLKIKK